MRETTEAVYRAESRRVFATLVRLLGDFDLAEEALHDAFRAALEQWPVVGIPDNPRAWLVSTGRFKAIDGIRRRSRFDALDDHEDEVEAVADETPQPWEDESIEDDRLRLIFTCCHPALAPDAQVALTLREVCGLTTEAIAQAFLSPAPTLAQRIVRAKAKIRDANIPYQVPTPDELPERLDSVLRVVYLVFNEGYSASSGASVTRIDLSGEAIRLGRLLVELLPEPEAIGLLALMLLQQSRDAARSSPSGELVLLNDQDRSLWNRDQVAEGSALVERALGARRFGPYQIQAAIAAVHANAATPEDTDWGEIVGLYEVLPAAQSFARHRTQPRRRRGNARRARGGNRAHRGDPRAWRSPRLPPRACGAWPISAVASEDSRRPEWPISAHWRSPGRSPSGAFSNGGWPSFPHENQALRLPDAVPRKKILRRCRFRARPVRLGNEKARIDPGPVLEAGGRRWNE